MLFLLVFFALFAAIFLHVAVLAKLLGVHELVGAANGRLGPTPFMITILAHAFCIELSILVRTVVYDFFLSRRGHGRLALVVVIRLLPLLSRSLLADNLRLDRLVRVEHGQHARVL